MREKLRAFPKFVLSIILATLVLAGCSKNAAELVERAMQRESKGQFAAAIVDLKAALQQEPNNATARGALGRLYNETFDHASAEKELRKARELGAVDGGRIIVELGRAMRGLGKSQEILSEVELSPAYENIHVVGIHVLRGRAHLLEGQASEARAALVEAQKLAADHPDVQLFDAVLRAASDLSGAEAIVETVLQKHPKHFEALAYKGRILRDQGKHAEAHDVYGKMLAINPRHFQALVNRATLSVGRGMLDEAKKDIDSLASFYKTHPQVHIQRGILQLASNQPRDALESAQLALKYQPEPVQAYLLAGMAHLEIASPRQAEAAFSKFLSHVPNSVAARRGLAQSLIQLNESAKALAVLAPLLETSKPDPAAYALAAEAHAKRGNFNEASRWYDKVSTLVPNDSRLLVRKVMLKFGAGQVNQGLDELAGAVETAKSATHADEILVLGLLARNRYDEAMAAIESMEKRLPDNAVTANLRGMALLARGNKQAAVRAFEHALKLQPEFFAAASNLARLDLMDANPNAARKRYDIVLQANPNHLAALLGKAELEALYGNMKSSVELLLRASKGHEKVLEAKVLLATAYVAMSDMREAVATVEDALAAHPDDPVALVLAANVQIRAGNVNRAIQAMSRLVQISPTPKAYLELARAQSWANRDNDAEASIKKALQLRSNFAPAQIALAGFLTDRGRVQDALHFARSIEAAQPKSAIGYMLEGEVHERQKKWDEAAAAYRAAMNREPMGFIASSIFRVRARSGNTKEALAELEQWVAKNPGDRLGRLTAAIAYLDAGNFKAAATRFEELLLKNARDPDALNGLAWAYQGLKDERALRVAEAAYLAAPLSPHAQDTLGWILVQKGDLQRGSNLLRMASKALPENLEVRFHLAVALHKSGDVVAARKELQSLLATNSDFSSAQEARALLASLK